MTRPEATERADAVTGVITVVMTLIGWSAVPLFIKYFSHSIDMWTSNGWRYGFSALLWAPVPIIGWYRAKLPEGLWRAAFIPAAINSMGQVCFTWAHYQIGPGLLTFGLRSQIVFVAIGAYLLFPQERGTILSFRYLAGMVVVTGGVIGTILFDDEPMRGAHAGGVVLSLASGFFFAAYGLSVRRYMHGINSVVAFAAISLYTAAAMVVLMLLLGDRAGLTVLDPEVLTGGQVALLLFSSVVGIALGHVFYYISIARLGVAISAGVIQLQPFGVSVGSYFWFGEVLRAPQWVSGIVAILGAMLMLSMQRRQRAADARPEPAPESDGSVSPGDDGQTVGKAERAAAQEGPGALGDGESARRSSDSSASRT